MKSIKIQDFPEVYIEEFEHKFELERDWRHYLIDLASQWKPYIKEGDLCIDIGAFSGDTSLVLGLLTGSTGKVLAFEPNPMSFSVLEKNSFLNKNSMNIVPVNKAISSVTGEVTVYSHGQWCQVAITKSNESSMVVNGITLEEALKDEILSPSFIKIDCEGYDKEILRSSKEYITSNNPILFVEWYLHFSKNESIELFDTIHSLGYTTLNPITLEKVAATSTHIPDLLCINLSKKEY